MFPELVHVRASGQRQHVLDFTALPPKDLTLDLDLTSLRFPTAEKGQLPSWRELNEQNQVYQTRLEATT